ncbi:MAG: hypothetical protein JWL86_5389 [Rhizobium sp.]|nr:hypothetical protein [Rhizobium sp.]
MSIQAVGWALDQDLPARPKLVLVAIANHANHVDGYCWLKAETIAPEASCSPRGVFNFVGDLIRNGFIRKAPRRGDDGKQRANDYWILFNREPSAWIARGKESEFEQDDLDDDTTLEAEANTQDVVVRDARRACGENDSPAAAEPVEIPARAVGPHAPACSHTDSIKPSKTNPLNAQARASTPRHYAPPPEPPPKPMGSTTADGSGDFIFVYAGTPAYAAWKAVKERETGRPWNGTMVKNGSHGWYFRTLFPPQAKPPPGAGTAAADEQIDPPFSKAG